jgi:hypothetical protein
LKSRLVIAIIRFSVRVITMMAMTIMTRMMMRAIVAAAVMTRATT